MKKIIKLLLIISVFFAFSIKTNASTYYVTGDGVRVRSSAKNANNIIGKLNYGDVIEVVSLNNSWYKIKYGNGYGYITYRYVSKLDDNYGTKTIALMNQSTNLKRSYSTSSSTIMTIPKYAVVKVLKEKNGWAYIHFNENLGYVKTSTLKKYTSKSEIAIGTYTINYSLNNNSKTSNMINSAQKINKVVIKNGEKFSFIRTIGKNGYLYAPEFTKNESIYGGGISQVATTLFLALRDAQRNNCYINITEQNRYGSKTPYAKLGEEAIINLKNNNDLVFTNKSGKTMKIYSYVNGNTVSISISVIL